MFEIIVQIKTKGVTGSKPRLQEASGAVLPIWIDWFRNPPHFGMSHNISCRTRFDPTPHKSLGPLRHLPARLDYPNHPPTNLSYPRRPPIYPTQGTPLHLHEVNPPRHPSLCLAKCTVLVIQHHRGQTFSTHLSGGEGPPRSPSLRRVSIQKPASRISQLSTRQNDVILPDTNL